MQGLTWLQRGHDVHVVSTCDESRAATTFIEHQLQETAKRSTARSRVHRYQFDIWKDGEVETAVRCLKTLSEGKQLCVNAVEVVRDDRKSFTEFCDQLIVQVPGVFFHQMSGDSNGPPPLQYRDVLVLCFRYPTDDRVKGFGLKTTTASGLVRGLRDCHVTMRMVKKGDEAAIRDTALGVGDLVTVASWDDVQGLERKVVVVETKFGGFDRLLAMSRCTSQLVLIDLRPV